MSLQETIGCVFRPKEYGSTPGAPANSGRLIQIKVDPVSGILIPLVQSSAVTGKVRLIGGEALARMRVRLLRSSYDALGNRTFLIASQVETNDRGEYRLFDVAPGKYYLSAADSQSIATLSENSANESSVRYPEVYFPSAESPAGASVIEVMPGTEIASMNITLSASSSYRISGGVVEAATGRPPERMTRVMGEDGQVSLRPAVRIYVYEQTSESNNAMETLSSTDPLLRLFSGPLNVAVAADGTFELKNLLPGRYWLLAQGNTAGAAGGELSAFVPVDLRSGNISNIQMRLAPGPTVHGRIELSQNSGSLVPVPETIAVRMDPILSGGYYSVIAKTDPAGTITFKSIIPGKYRLRIPELPGGLYVASVQYQGYEGLVDGLLVTGTSDESIHIILERRSGRAQGLVSDAQGRTVTGARVVLIPDQKPGRTDLYRETVSDASGKYQLNQIIAGEYTLYAWATMDGYPYFDPKFILPLQGSATPVHIEQDTVVTRDVRAIPNPSPRR